MRSPLMWRRTHDAKMAEANETVNCFYQSSAELRKERDEAIAGRIRAMNAEAAAIRELDALRATMPTRGAGGRFAAKAQ